MPRTIWSGAISFGLVTVPIHVRSAVEDHSIHFRQYHLKDMSRVRVRKICELEDREVAQDEIGKGYEVSKDQVVAVLDEELRALPLPTAKAIEIETFVPADSIDPLQIGEGYYLEPDGQIAAKPYTLLRRALERSAKVAVAKFAWSGRERLGLLRVIDQVIVLHAMKWPDEIRDPSSLAPQAVEVDEKEIEQAQALIDGMTRDDLEGEEFTDRYTDALAEVIKAKRGGSELPESAEPAAQSGQVVDLMAALQESVAKARVARGEDATVHEMPRKKAAAGRTAKKTAAKETAAKKTAKKTAKTAGGTAKKAPAKAAKKAPAKKTAAKKPRRSA
ncbi:non-homologous end joining protein Ku [Streptomyces fructofermentans]|uniref:Non-homologous end joining protein Ku n=1 Tax=Streptomyces fructofermentans TaxID=152141 RepID=A0A918NEZ9_9ACTN|nr:Ku protein [Streptomyces fructofermentans]GGX62921.1 non-homologous end joining protein Ku [Streptomyces fructofermentans]